MFRGIIGLVEGTPEGEIKSNRGSTDIEAELVETFDGGRLVSGKAVASLEREREVPVVREDYITTEEEMELEKVYTEFLANLGDGWVTVDTGDGEFVWNFLSMKHRVTIERAEVDINAFAREIRDEWDRVDVWQSQVSWGDPEDEEDPGGVTIAYHSDAEWSDGDRMGQLGFDGNWNGQRVRGTITDSGYIAIYNRGEETSAAFLSEAVMPHCSIPVDEDEQFAREALR